MDKIDRYVLYELAANLLLPFWKQNSSWIRAYNFPVRF